MKVKLSSCGNPDYRQDPNASISPAETISVETLKEASERCESYIARWDLGGGNWAGGQVYDAGKQIARISYNGRIWGMNGNEINEED